MKYYLPAFLWAIVIFSLSTNAPVELPQFSLLGADKIGHFAAYCILASLWLAGYIKQEKWQQLHRLKMWLPIVGASFYGASIEFVQASLPHRSFDYADMLANMLGALLGLFLIILIKKWLLVKTNNFNN